MNAKLYTAFQAVKIVETNKQTKKDWQLIKYSKGANLATCTYQASPVFSWAFGYFRCWFMYCQKATLEKFKLGALIY